MIKHTVKFVLRNILGYTLFCIGLVLSIPVVPGPGFAFILAGIAIADWPGKLRFFHWLRTFHWFDALEHWMERKFKFSLPGKRNPGAPAMTLSPDCPAGSNDAPGPAAVNGSPPNPDKDERLVDAPKESS